MTDCQDGHCVTCSDQAVPMRVLAVCGRNTALCDGGIWVMIDLLDRVDVGDVLLVHAGTAIAREP
jgi:hydrogenase expression/formation protein HypC